MIVFSVIMYLIMTYLVFMAGVGARDEGYTRLGAWMILTCWLPVIWIIGFIIAGFYYIIWEIAEGIKSCGIDVLKTLLKDAFGRNR